MVLNIRLILNLINLLSTAPYGRNSRGAGHIGVNDLPRVATRHCGGLESNPQPQRSNHRATEPH